MTKARRKSAGSAVLSTSPAKARGTRRSVRRAGQASWQIALAPDALSVAKGGEITVRLSFSGLDRVALSLEPKRLFALDVREAIAPTTVHLAARRDGIATLIATGYSGSRAVTEQLLHVRCIGPTVRIHGLGYKAPRS